MRSTILALAALIAAISTPAHADLVADCAAMTTAKPCITYTGSVIRHSTKQTDATDLMAGVAVTFTLEYDPLRVTDFGFKTLTDGDGNQIVVHPLGVTFDATDKMTSALLDYEITAGAYSWTLAEDANYNASSGLNANGVGPFPFVAFDGMPTKLLGVEADATNAQGLEFVSTPGEFLLDENDTESDIFNSSGRFVASIETSLDMDIQAARAEDLAAAQVPEPSSWALLILGGIGLWTVSRRRARAAAETGPIGQFA